MTSTIWTVGHSNRTFDEFVACLRAHDIGFLVDVRRYPGSRKYPHFNVGPLVEGLAGNNVRYLHIVDLGGRRKTNPDSANTGWRNLSFRAYADYMETAEFRQATAELLNIASQTRTAYMCSEALWWQCHRRLISDFLVMKEWKVLHILSASKTAAHSFMEPAKIVDGKLTYEP
jgi:uncharacterized protein (DUF488 family)